MTTNESSPSEEPKSTPARHEVERLVPEEEIGNWECIECGNVRENSSRPTICPSCNRDDGDMPTGVFLYAPVELDDET